MSVRAKRRLLYTLSASLIAGTGAAVLYGLQTPETIVPRHTKSTISSPTTNMQPGTDPTTQQDQSQFLSATTQIRLQRPLYDPPKPKPVVPKIVRQPPAPKPKPIPQPVAPKVELSLLGTLIENDRAVAIVADANGVIDQKRIGDTLNLQPSGVVVEDIQSGAVVVSHKGKRLTFSIVTNSADQSKSGAKTDKKAKRDRTKNKQRRSNR